MVLENIHIVINLLLTNILIYNNLDNGEEYEGEWKNDKKHGNGILKLKNGAKIEG